MSATGSAPHELLEDGFAPLRCDLLVVGCGNILRGDDAVGPRLIRQLWEQGVPDQVRIADGGTAGMDVAFQMRGASRVVIVDASSTGAEPGTIYRVPGEELAQTPPLEGIHTHSFRWDHALSFSRWLLGPAAPSDITVFLIEAADLTPGADLSAPVQRAMEEVAAMLRREYYPEQREPDQVEITGEGYLRISAAMATRRFPADVCGVVGRQGTSGGRELLLLPLWSQANGGQLLKRRNAAGDRVVLVREVLADELPVGCHAARWDDDAGAVVVILDEDGRTDDRRGPDGRAAP